VTSPTPPGDGGPRGRWRRALAADAACPPLERLTVPAVSGDDAAHVASCPRCQGERALWASFDAPGGTEDSDVTWIAEDVRRRIFPDVAPAVTVARRRLAAPAWGLSLAASLLLVAGAYLLIREPGAEVDDTGGAAIYRTAGIEPLAPLGDVATPPDELRWRPVVGAARYDLRIMEVDGTELWRGSTTETAIAVPVEVQAAARPARRLEWSVTAVDAAARPVAAPASASFRVIPPQG
jgi:hypothetical protein